MGVEAPVGVVTVITRAAMSGEGGGAVELTALGEVTTLWKRGKRSVQPRGQKVARRKGEQEAKVAAIKEAGDWSMWG